MLCTHEFDLCSDCPAKYVIIVTAVSGEDLYFCFDAEIDARNAYDIMNHNNFYCGEHLTPKTAVLMIPKTEV